MIHKHCDGSKVKFKPIYRRTSECSECGAVSKIKPYIINTPDFHKGPFEGDKCLACGKEDMEIGLLVTFKILEEGLVKGIIEEWDKPNIFLEFLKKKDKT